MNTILLIIIYICYIGLGVPDSLLGTAWPAIYVEFLIPISCVSFVSLTISGRTVLSSLLSAGPRCTKPRFCNFKHYMRRNNACIHISADGSVNLVLPAGCFIITNHQYNRCIKVKRCTLTQVRNKGKITCDKFMPTSR